MIIGIEGFEYTGKTSLKDALKDHLESKGRSVVTIHNPYGLSQLTEDIVLYIKENIRALSQDEISAFILSTHVMNTQAINDYHNQGYDVIVDRTFYSMFVYQFKDHTIKEFNKLISSFGLDRNTQYDIMFCLYADKNETFRRAQESLMDNLDVYYMEHLDKHLKRYEKALFEAFHSYYNVGTTHWIDTTDKTRNEVMNEATKGVL